MSRKVKINPYTGETLKEPLIVYEDQPLTPEMFYGLETIKAPEDSMVNNPIHYQSMVKDLNIDAISCMRAAFGDECVKDFCICNALKYIYRNQNKNGKQDILKAIWYLNKFMELEGTDNE
jgi:hypothetical protein